MTTKRYRAKCLVCYSVNLGPKPTGKREAERLCVSHMNRYDHETTMQEEGTDR